MNAKSFASMEFVEVHGKLAARAARAVRTYVKNPDEKNTHDMRVAIRRVNTLMRTVPKKERSKAMRRYRARCRKILRLTSRVRDLDIIQGKLARHNTKGTLQSVLKDLTEDRGGLASESMKTARKLRDSATPRVVLKNPSHFALYVGRTLEEFDDEIAGRLPIVMNDERNVSELHALRRYMRRLRYLLELLPRSPRISATYKILRDAQNALGEIRDSDVVVQYLSESQQSYLARELLLGERTFRHNRYEAFVHTYSNRFRNEKTSVLAMAGLGQH
jgi:CHAD domain-containing protein